jgi:hypothetical protein
MRNEKVMDVEDGEEIKQEKNSERLKRVIRRFCFMSSVSCYQAQHLLSAYHWHLSPFPALKVQQLAYKMLLAIRDGHIVLALHHVKLLQPDHSANMPDFVVQTQLVTPLFLHQQTATKQQLSIQLVLIASTGCYTALKSGEGSKKKKICGCS